MSGRRLGWGQRWVLLVCTLLVACGGTATPPSGPTGGGTTGGTTSGSTGGATPAIRILWIGNSYTYVNDLPALVTSLSRAANRLPLPVNTAVLEGGQTLKGAYNRADLAAVIARGWDVVVLQEQSTTPLTAPDTMRKYGTLLAEAAKRAGARVLLFETWPEAGAATNAPLIRAAYEALARVTDGVLVPVGQGWSTLAAARPDLSLYLEDGSHPSPTGTYLAACIFHNLLYSRSAIGLAAQSQSVRTNRYVGAPDGLTPVTLDAATARTIQEIADRVTGR